MSNYSNNTSRFGSTCFAIHVDAEDEREEDPTEPSTISSSSGFLLVSPDMPTVKYTTVNMQGHDVGVVQGNRPVRVKRLVCYFKIHEKIAGSKGQIAIGFTCEGFKRRRQPGCSAWMLSLETGPPYFDLLTSGKYMGMCGIGKRWWDDLKDEG